MDEFRPKAETRSIVGLFYKFVDSLGGGRPSAASRGAAAPPALSNAYQYGQGSSPRAPAKPEWGSAPREPKLGGFADAPGDLSDEGLTSFIDMWNLDQECI